MANKEILAFIHLLSSALNKSSPEESLLVDVDLSYVLALSKAHTVGALVASAFLKTDLSRTMEEKDRKAWSDLKTLALRKSMLLDAERKAILGEMEEKGIWYMPLKGTVLQNYYPEYGTREMADNDILFDPAGREQVKDIFLSRGFEVEGYGRSNHDVYKKKPVYNYEMHVALFSSSAYPTLSSYFANVEEKLLPDEGNRYGRHFSKEDFYIHVLAHAWKHYHNSGTGIRTLVDIFVLDKAIGGDLERSVVEEGLRTLGVLDYERKCVELSRKLFSGRSDWMETLTEEEKEMLSYYLGSSTYGTMDNYARNRLESMQRDGKEITTSTKLRYVLGRAFPGRNFFREPYPFFYKYPVFIPFFWFWRILSRPWKRIGNIREELKSVKEV